MIWVNVDGVRMGNSVKSKPGDLFAKKTQKVQECGGGNCMVWNTEVRSRGMELVLAEQRDWN